MKNGIGGTTTYATEEVVGKQDITAGAQSMLVARQQVESPPAAPCVPVLPCPQPLPD